MNRLHWSLVLLGAALAAGPALAETERYAEENDPIVRNIKRSQARVDEEQKMEREADQRLERRKAQEEAGIAREKRDLEMLGQTGLLRSNDVEYDAKEPGSPADVVNTPPQEVGFDEEEDIFATSQQGGADKYFHFIRQPVWSLKPEDFRFLRPVPVTIESDFASPVLLDGKEYTGRAKPFGVLEAAVETHFMTGTEKVVPRDTFLAIPFSLTNSTDMDLRMHPRMWIVSENLRFTQELGGFIVQEEVSKTLFRQMEATYDLIGYIKTNPDGSTEPAQTVLSGQTRNGVAVFPTPDPELDRMLLVVDGLNNTYRFDRRQKKVLAIEFDRPGDEYHHDEHAFEFRGKNWKWMWMWYEEISVTGPTRFEYQPAAVARPRPKVLWAYQVSLTNRTDETQQIRIRAFDTVVRVPAPPIVQAQDSPYIEVEFLDEGESTVHKARVMEEMALRFQAKRFFAGAIEPGQIKTFPVIFDEDDVAWDSVYEQVERLMTGNIAIGYGEPPLKPGMGSFIPEREKLSKVKRYELSDQEKEGVREAVMGAIPAALASERERRIITANVAAECGIASGVFRIAPSYFRPGVIEPEWIHKWSEYE